MLDNQTKRLIDSARDILVGKVPDPKGQIEHITIALIYKFMDDMDNETVVKYGGKAKYFTGEYEKYSWRKLFDPKLGGHDMLALYRDAIDKMYLNPNIPDLFKNIFKNAYLSFNSPETLKMFLKTINEFNYDHSENLGNAYEYLLSVLGTQGDAGQFRTPRHIIEFIVACVDPQKHESILDPACGTAGFILSSYKHILKHNDSHFNTSGTLFDQLSSGENNNGYRGDKLTPDERKHIADNLVGFDIDPNMVRFSLVNMFLHKFQTPHIYEYDTLSSEERWNEYYQVIVANPPFMTPKGGIKPHKRFSIQATKSEVLFTDYMAEHLTPNGRAGIIVPNGIIATTQTAYKSLRKMLVENYLVAVVSLPAGVFNPYSGVKTSILLLDKKLSKITDSILFLKVENDGYDLGAQRREIEKNDLPEALRIFIEYKTSILSEKEFNPTENRIGTFVKKETILANKDVNLSAERYVKSAKLQTEFDIVQLGQIAEVISGQSPEGSYYNDKAEGLPFYQGRTDFGDIYLEKPTKWTTQITREAFKNDILMSVRAPVGPVNISTERICIGRGLAAIRPIEDVDLFYLFYILRSQNGIIKGNGGAVFDSISREQIKEIEIPLPPLEIQKQIVAEIESYQKIINGARMVVDNYKPTIKINPEWEMLELGEVCEIKSGGTPSRDRNEYWENGNIPWVKTGEINYGVINSTEEAITILGLNNSSAKLIPKDTILMAMYGQGVTRGRVAILGIEATINQACAAFLIKDKKKILTKFLFQILQVLYQELRLSSDGHGNNQSNLSATIIKEFNIPIPSLEEQTTIVSQIEEEQKMVEANKKLITLFEQKIKDRIAEVWGEKE